MLPCIFYPNDPIDLPQQQQQERSDFHHKDTAIIHNEGYCDPYQVLHIRRDATRHEMKRSYQQLALLYHPSIRSSMTSTTPSATATSNTTNGNNTHPIPVSIDSQQQQQKLFLFTIIAACYETLSVKETRQRLDQILLQQNKQKNQYQSSSPFLTTADIGQSMKNRHSTIVVAATTEVGTTQFRSPKRENRIGNTNDTNQNQRNTMIISKEEQKIRHKLQQERRIQQQERRDQKKVDTKRKKSNYCKKQRSHKQQQTHPMLVPTGSTTSSTVSSPYPHQNRKNRTDDKDNIIVHKNLSCDYDDDDDDTSTVRRQHQQRIERKNIRRGYDWAYHYVSSTSCGCTDSDHNHHHHQHHSITSVANNNKNSNTMIPYDEQSPIDRMNYQNHTNNPFRKTPITVVRRNTNKNANDNPYTEPPSMVGSSDSESCDDYNDDRSTDDPLSIKNIIMIDPFQQQKVASLGTKVSDTERWFGGPFRLMYRARKFEPFTDPFVLFERTFRSELVDSKRHQQHQQQQQQLSTQEFKNSRQPPESTNTSKVFDTKMQQQLYHNVPPSALIALTSSNYMIPLSAADDKIETLKDGSIVTRTDRIQTAIVPQESIFYTSSLQQQPMANQYQMHKTISRTITRYPPDPLSTTHRRRMAVTVTSDYEIVPIHHKNNTTKLSNDYFVDCFSWITCDALSDILQQ